MEKYLFNWTNDIISLVSNALTHWLHSKSVTCNNILIYLKMLLRSLISPQKYNLKTRIWIVTSVDKCTQIYIKIKYFKCIFTSNSHFFHSNSYICINVTSFFLHWIQYSINFQVISFWEMSYANFVVVAVAVAAFFRLFCIFISAQHLMRRKIKRHCNRLRDEKWN